MLGTAATLLLAALGAIALAVAVFVLWPARRRKFQSHPEPAIDYAAAVARAAKTFDDSGPEVCDACRGTILDHGRRTRDAYVLVHGLTNCPAQFRKFADILHARGANVLLPRLPYHGFVDRMTPDQAGLTAQDLLDSTNAAVDLARGYGERVIVVGLSASAVAAAWLAQERDDIELAVAIAPFLAPMGFVDPIIHPFANTLLRLPNTFFWWNGRQKEALVGSPYCYPRFATHPIGETMLLGLELFHRARRKPPAARKILLVTSPRDVAVSLPRIAELAALWKDRAQALTFPPQWRIHHDCIDPTQPGQKVDRVYPQLIAWMDESLN
jgi:carboxylesterase